jgi:hypothetical protein
MIIEREQAYQYLIKGNILKRTYYSNLNGDVYTSYIYVASEPYEETLHNNLTLEAIKYRNVKPIDGKYVFQSKQKRYFVADIFNGTIELMHCSNPFIKETEFQV